MFIHQHPYPPFIPENATRLIIGTIPPPRFTTGDLLSTDVDFCYGSKFGLLWPILDKIFDLDLSYEPTEEAILQRKLFLRKEAIGICDIIERCRRQKMDASDLGMHHIELRNILTYLKENKKIATILFMGGNSKNGPEFLFRKHLKPFNLDFKVKDTHRPRRHYFTFDNRTIHTVSLISPSSAANRSIGGDPLYKLSKKKNPKFTTFDFRVEQYRNYFT